MEINKRNQIKPFVTKDSSIIRELMNFKNSSVKNLSLAVATLQPGKSTIEHYHEKSEEIYYILEGRGIVKVGEETSDVEKGDAILIPTGSYHKICNNGGEDLVFLCCCSPGYNNEDTKLIKRQFD